MYVLNRLERMILEEDNDIKRILAAYFIQNASKPLSLQKCIDETGVSKSAIYNFFSEAGFKSFKRFLRILNEENILMEYHSRNQKYDFMNDFEFDVEHIKTLVNKIKKADNIYFYGNQKEINLFQETIFILVQKGYNIKSLNVWNVDNANRMLDNLKENDIFIIIDTSYRLNVYFDMRAVNPNMIDLDKVNDSQFQKFYIGKRNIEENTTQVGFNIIYMDKRLENMTNIGLLLLDKYISTLLKGE